MRGKQMMAVKQPNSGERVWVDRATGEVINLDRAYAESDRQMAASRRKQAQWAAAGLSGPARNWYVLVVEPGADIPVDSDLVSRKVETWVPLDTFLSKPRPGREQSARSQLAIPGYVFVHIEATDDVLQSLLATDGVVAPIGGWTMPKPVHDKDIGTLRAFLALSPFERKKRIRAEAKASRNIAVGAAVRIVNHPAEGHAGVVIREGRDGCLRIDVAMMGGTVAMNVPVANLQIIG